MLCNLVTCGRLSSLPFDDFVDFLQHCIDDILYYYVRICWGRLRGLYYNHLSSVFCLLSIYSLIYLLHYCQGLSLAVL